MKALKIAAIAALVAGSVAVTSMLRGADAATGSPSALNTITPCRLVDTRPLEFVGEHNGPFGPGEVGTLAVVGVHGNCSIPAGATAISANVTIINPTAAGYLTLYPSGTGPPTASNLNWVAGQAPTANQALVGLGVAGTIDVFNNAGTVDVIIDVNGYYTAGGGTQGPPGPQGTATAYGKVDGFMGAAELEGASANVSGVFRTLPHTGFGPANGSYCVAFDPPIPQAQLDSAVISGSYGQNYPVAVNSDQWCFDGELGVQLFGINTGLLQNGSFSFVVP